MVINISLNRRTEIGRERRGRTRTKLIAAAARVIAARGEENARIEDFIIEAGVARGTFYNYFLTREALIDAVWKYLGKAPFNRIQDLCATLDDPAERIIAEFRLVAAKAEADPTWGWLIYSMTGQHPISDDLLTFPAVDLSAGMAVNRFRFEILEVARDLIAGAARSALRATLEGRGGEVYIMEMGRGLLLSLGISENEAVEISRRPLPSEESLAKPKKRGPKSGGRASVDRISAK